MPKTYINETKDGIVEMRFSPSNRVIKTEPFDTIRFAPPGIYGKRAEIVDGKKRFVSRMLFGFSADQMLECLRISSSDKSGEKLKKYLRELLVKSGVRLTKHEKQIFGGI